MIVHQAIILMIALVTIIQFDPLAEEDEDEYTCYAVINGSFMFESISLQNIISYFLDIHTYIHDYACHVRYKSTTFITFITPC